LKGVVDEIIVVHDGECTDKSLSICKKYRCKIYTRKFAGMCEGHKVWIFNQVKTQGILQIDADEFLSPSLAKKLPQLAKNENVYCYEFVWPYWDGKKYLTEKWPWRRALFQKDKASYLGFPHEEIQFSGNVTKVPLLLEHRPSSNSLDIKTLSRKWRRWLPIHAKFLINYPKNVDRFPKKALIKPHYLFLKDHPLLLALPLGTAHFLVLALYGKSYKAGPIGVLASFYMGVYYFLLGLNIWRLKNAKNE
jgi:glycosyltransferase involved in cell wall biosynthesis